eukprot:3496918-Prymnesium_polylepis.1
MACGSRLALATDGVHTRLGQRASRRLQRWTRPVRKCLVARRACSLLRLPWLQRGERYGALTLCGGQGLLTTRQSWTYVRRMTRVSPPRFEQPHLLLKAGLD